MVRSWVHPVDMAEAFTSKKGPHAEGKYESNFHVSLWIVRFTNWMLTLVGTDGTVKIKNRMEYNQVACCYRERKSSVKCTMVKLFSLSNGRWVSYHRKSTRSSISFFTRSGLMHKLEDVYWVLIPSNTLVNCERRAQSLNNELPISQKIA